MQIETLPVELLIPYARNARTHSDAQVAQIAGSIREFGFTNPVLIDADGGIIAGHGRVLAARKLGMQEVPCIRLGHLTEIQKRAYVIADNKLALNAGWDYELLSLELGELKDLDIDLGFTGFSDGEISNLLSADWEPHETESLQDKSDSNNHKHTIKLSEEQLATWEDALDYVRDDNLSMSEGDALVLIAREWLNDHHSAGG